MSKEEPDDLASVRIELDGGGASPDAPQVEAPSGGPATWVLGLGVLVLVAVVGAFIGLRPSGDEAADGTERVAPGTTIPTSEADDAGDPNEVLAVIEVIDRGQANRAEVSRQAINRLPFDWIVPTSDGFLGLPGFASLAGALTQGTVADVVAPPLFSSPDGMEWEPVEVTVLAEGSPNVQSYRWSRLSRIDSGYAVVGSILNTGLVDLFLSPDGVTWERVESFGAAGGIEEAVLPISVDGDTITQVEFSDANDVLVQALAEHTSIDLGSIGVCGAFGLAEALRVVDCAFNSLPLGAQEVTSQIDPDQVLRCISSIGRLSFGGAFVRSSVVGRDGGEAELVEGGSSLRSADPVAVAAGSVAFIDIGQPNNVTQFLDPDACEGVVQLPGTTPGAVVVIDPVSRAVQRIPFPNGLLPAFEPPRLVGEVSSVSTSSGGRRHLLVAFELDGLWAVDIETEEWTMLDDQADPLQAAQFVVSESGRRAYWLAEQTLTAYDFDFGDDGVTRVQSTEVPIADDVVLDGLDRIIYADDEELFFVDVDGFWQIDVPAAADPIDPNAPVIEALRLDLEFDAFEIVDAGVGFLALGESTDTTNGPPIWRSIDGIDWFPVDTSFDGVGDDDPTDLSSSFWFGLTETVTGFSLTGGLGFESREPLRTFVSTDGVTWRPDGQTPEIENPGFLIPISVDEDAVTYLQFIGNQELAGAVAQHTSIDLDVALCDAIGGVEGVSLDGCFGEQITVLPDDVTSDSSPDDVLRCLTALGQRVRLVSQVVRIDRTGGAVQVIPGSQVPWDFSGPPVMLSNDRLALLAPSENRFDIDDFSDFQNSEPAACGGIVTFEPFVETPVLLVIDNNSQTATQLPLPQSASGEDGISPLGEVLAGEGEQPRLLVEVDGRLWVLDADSGLWEELGDVLVQGLIGNGSAFDISTSGKRVHVVDGDLTIIDFATAEDGTPSTFAISASLDNGASTNLNLGRILHSNDEVIFYQNVATNGRGLWRLAVPETATE